MRNFTKRLLVAGALVAAIAPVNAQMNERVVPSQVYSKAVSAQMKFPGKEVKKAPIAKEAINPTDYGTEVGIVSESFSKMSYGTESEPDMDKNDMNYDNPDNVWINLLSDYTETEGWGSLNAYPAGGALYLYGTDGGARLNTPMLKLSGNSGIAFVSLRARRLAKDPELQYGLDVEGAETYNMAPSWKILGSHHIDNITTEWQTYTFMFYGCGDYTLFNIYTPVDQILIDDVKVYQIDQYAPTTAGHKHDTYRRVDDNTASFNISWDAVEGADGYLLDLYQLDDNGTPNYLRKDLEVKGNTYTVSDAPSGDILYYTVRTKKNGHTSIPSEAVQIKDVAEPNPTIVSTEGSKYTTKWNNVPGAERYNLTTFYKRTAQEDGQFTVTDLHLSGMKYDNVEVTDGEDIPEVEFSTDNPDYHTYDFGALPNYAGQGGWELRHYAIYKDALTVDGFWTTEGKSDAGLISPEMDLSKDNGKFKVSLRACAEYSESYDAYARAAVALFTYNDEKKDYEQKELVYPGAAEDNYPDADWKNYDVDFTSGTDRSIVGIYATWCPTNLYLQKVKITQNYKAGDTFLDPCVYKRWLKPTDEAQTTVTVSLPEKADKADIYQRATSIRVGTEGDQFSGAQFLESAFSPMQYVGVADVPVGISKTGVSVSGATVSVEGGNIVVNNPEKAQVFVYNVDGTVVASDNSRAEVVNIPTTNHGNYIVKVGKQSIKVVF